MPVARGLLESIRCRRHARTMSSSSTIDVEVAPPSTVDRAGVFSWGGNSDSQHGLLSTLPLTTPRQCDAFALEDVVVGAGDGFSVVIGRSYDERQHQQQHQQLWGAGLNAHGQLGRPPAPPKTGAPQGMTLSKTLGEAAFQSATLPHTAQPITQISCGRFHTLLLTRTTTTRADAMSLL